MSKRKIRFDMLVENTSVSITRIKNQLSNPETEITSLLKLIEEIAVLNEKEFYLENNDLPVTNSKEKITDTNNMLEVVLRLFAHELSTEAKKIDRIKHILK